MNQITPLPTAPSRNRPETFSSEADAFLAAIPPFATEANALATELNANTMAVYTALSNTSAEVIGAIATMWEAGDYTQGDMVWSPTNSLNYRAKSTFTSSVDPANDLANWVAMRDSIFLFEDRSSDTALNLDDRGKIINATGAYTQSFVTASALGAGWWTMIRCVSGQVVLDPYAAETIDGQEFISMLPGETRLIQSNGTSLTSLILSGFMMALTESVSDLMLPSGYTQIGFTIAGGSGGGESGAVGAAGVTIYGGIGGGGAGVFHGVINLPADSATIDIDVGAAGVGGASVETDDTGANPGTDGGNTSITINGTVVAEVIRGKGGNRSSSSLGASGGGVGSYAPGTTAATGFRVTIGNTSIGGYKQGEFGGGASYSANDPGTPSIHGGGSGASAGYIGTTGGLYTQESNRVGGSSDFANDGGGSGWPFSITANGGDGADGETAAWLPAGGGGGGAPARNGYNSGKGGDGGPGYAIIWGAL